METNRTMRNRSEEWDGSTEKKGMFVWSDVVLPDKQQGATEVVW